MNTYQLTTNKNIYNKVLNQLYQVRKQLRKARFWGVLDISGGGLIITKNKRESPRL